LAAHQLKEGILIALIKKLKTGKGSKVSVSLFDTAITSLVNQASNWLMAKHNPQPIGSLHPNIAPYGEIISTRDNKKIVLAVGNNKQFEKLCMILNAPILSTDAKFNTNTARLSNRTELLEQLKKLIHKCHSGQLMPLLIQEGVPAGLVKSVEEVFESPDLKPFILREKLDSGETSTCVKTVAFTISI
ncbi:MAG: CoA transferase, partial [Bacteroidetes bacterium]|nr:CoA transferase [Bacteroidota bacterium]